MTEFFSPFSLGEEKWSIEQKLGAPLSEVQQGITVIAQYTSQLSLRSDYIHYRDARAVLFSESWYEKPSSFEVFESEFGQAEIIFYSTQPGERESGSGSALVVWPEQGVAVYTTFVGKDGEVIRVQRFEKMTSNQYKQDFSYLLTSYREQHSVTQEEVSVSDKAGIAPFVDIANLPFMSVVVLLVAIVLALFLWKLRKRKGKTLSPNIQPISENSSYSYNPSGKDPSVLPEKKLSIPFSQKTQ